MERIKTYKDFVGELTVNYKRTKLPTGKIQSSKSAADYMRSYFDNCMDDHEEVKVLHLNRNHQVVNVHHVTSGSEVASLFPIKDILRQALVIKVLSILVIHNHPSSNLKASKSDIEVSIKLRKACQLMDITMLDSIILTREGYTSLADEGLL